jgi:tRNA threonylcarbamoyladenosine biosynthesis protein TsaE
MKTLQFPSITEADMLQVAEEILSSCENERIFAFYGNLGAGKTTLIKRFCSLLGVEEAVSSPTFNLVNVYEGEEYEIYHFDFYRIKDEMEALGIGAQEYFDSGEYCLIEWPERIPNLLPEEAVTIQIEILDSSRNILVN